MECRVMIGATSEISESEASLGSSSESDPSSFKKESTEGWDEMRRCLSAGREAQIYYSMVFINNTSLLFFLNLRRTKQQSSLRRNQLITYTWPPSHYDVHASLF